MIVITILLFLLIFGFIVISHELGHFLLAKKNGIRVVEFAIGMGPNLFSYTKGDTKYSLKALPIGGACIFDGEDGNAENGSFQSASVWARISAVVAGPLFNLILALFLSLIVVAYRGVDLPVIQEVTENSAAEEAGLQAGDKVTKINNSKIRFYSQINFMSQINKGEALQIEFERDGVKNEVNLTPRFSETDNRYYIGLYGQGEWIKCNPIQLFQYGYYEMEDVVRMTFMSLGMLVRGEVKKDDLAGPVGMAQIVGETYQQAAPYGAGSVALSMMNIAILLSVNLGILNLLPFPALDGGRLVFLLLEAVRGKPVAPEKEGMVHLAGMVALMLLMVFVLFNDIQRLIR